MTSHLAKHGMAQNLCKSNQRIYTVNCGSQVRCGRRQSMPSSSIDNCARVSETVPLSACGQTKRPRSNRFANKHNPSPSNHRSFTRSPRRPRKMNTCPDIGLLSNLVCTKALSPWKPRRRSVTPAAIQICVWLGRVIIAADTPTTHATKLDWRRFRCALAHAAVGCASCPPNRLVIHQLQAMKPAAEWNSPLLLEPAPVEDQIGVDSMHPGYPRHRCSLS